MAHTDQVMEMGAKNEKGKTQTHLLFKEKKHHVPQMDAKPFKYVLGTNTHTRNWYNVVYDIENMAVYHAG